MGSGKAGGAHASIVAECFLVGKLHRVKQVGISLVSVDTSVCRFSDRHSS